MSYTPTPETKKIVAALAADGIPTQKIASYVGISKPTLFKYYRQELDCGIVDRLRKVSETLYQIALSGNVAACMFIMKTQAGWREAKPVEENEYEEDQTSVDKIQIEILD